MTRFKHALLLSNRAVYAPNANSSVQCGNGAGSKIISFQELQSMGLDTSSISGNVPSASEIIAMATAILVSGTSQALRTSDSVNGLSEMSDSLCLLF